eukprot:TRINITY_DN1238_c0_g1_i5.p1 TRINITY_DN1238_c0_g1~~TRINITY_DN1238_c0_g1_i5.p1  ORF type:complete len:501 (+),score=40.51 TRINITY_DN1238_c0_g1_i5:63-1565(+)
MQLEGIIAVPWLIFIGVVVGVVILNLILVKCYTHSQKGEAFTTIASVFSLSLTLLTVFMIPVDIFSVTHSSSAGPFQAVKIIYYALYGGVLLFAFIIMPVAYFFYESYDPEGTTSQRCCDTFKYSIAFIIIVIVLFITGLVIKPGVKINDRDIHTWIEHLFDTSNRGENAISFVIACLTLLGYLVWISYTAYGLSAFPIGLIKGKRSASDEKVNYEQKTQGFRSLWKKLSSKEQKTKRDENKIRFLKDEERTAEIRSKRLEKATTGCMRIFVIFRPFAFIFGFLFLLVSLLIVISISLTNIDKVMQDYCGSKCGFFLQYGPKLFNPFDQLLVVVSRFFPMDYIIMALVVCYIFISTISGVTAIGIRFLWMKLFPFKIRGTAPQGLLCASWLLMLSVLALNNQIITLAPTYATFGSQKQKIDNGTTVPCSFKYLAPNGTCRMTVIGALVSKVNITMPFFGIAFYWMTWAFILFWLVGLFVAICKKKASNIEEYSDDELGDF